MNQHILQMLQAGLIPSRPAQLRFGEIPAASQAAPPADQRPVDIERVRRVLVSIRDCSEWPDAPDHLKLYWINAYTNSLLMRLAGRTDEADSLLARCNELAAQMRRVIEIVASDEAGAIVPAEAEGEA